VVLLVDFARNCQKKTAYQDVPKGGFVATECAGAGAWRNPSNNTSTLHAICLTRNPHQGCVKENHCDKTSHHYLLFLQALFMPESINSRSTDERSTV